MRLLLQTRATTRTWRSSRSGRKSRVSSC